MSEPLAFGDRVRVMGRAGHGRIVRVLANGRYRIEFPDVIIYEHRNKLSYEPDTDALEAAKQEIRESWKE